MKYSKSAYWEILYPFIISIIISAIFILAYKRISLDFKGLVDASLNLFGILIGFFITVLTIINTLENTYIRALKKGNSFHLLNMYLKHAIWGCFTSIVFSILYILFWSTIISFTLKEWIEAFFLLIFLFAIISSYRFIQIFLSLTLNNKN